MPLVEFGPFYGYYAKPSKSIIIIKEDQFQKATALFADLQVEAVLAGRFVGGCIGNEEGIRRYMQQKINMWAKGIEQLGGAARAYSQSAYFAFIHPVSCEWSYFQRDTEGCVTTNSSSCVTLSDRCSLQQCWEERCLKESTQSSSCLLSWAA